MNLRYRAAVERILIRFGTDQNKLKKMYIKKMNNVLHTINMSLKRQLILNENCKQFHPIRSN